MHLQSAIRAGGFIATLAAIEGEYIVQDGFVPPPPGDDPPAGYSEDVAPGALESFQVQAERDGISYLVTFETADAQNRLPVSAVSLSGTATSTSSASGTLSVAGVTVDVSYDTDFVPGIPPALCPEQAAIDSIAEANERLPVNPIALAGSAASASSAMGTASLAGADISPDKDTAWVATLGPPTDPLTPSLMAAEGEHNIVDGFVPGVAADGPFEDDSAACALVVAQPIGPPIQLEEPLPVAPVALSGSASSSSAATGTLGVSALPGEALTPEVPQPAPHIEAEPESLPVSPVAISGSATSSGTVSGTLGVAALPPLEDPVPLAPVGAPTHEEAEVPIAPVALSGSASSASTATGSIGVSALAPLSDPLPQVEPGIVEHPGPEPVFGPVALSGATSSSSSTAGVVSVGSLPLGQDEPYNAPQVAVFDVAALAAAEGEQLAESGAAAVPTVRIEIAGSGNTDEQLGGSLGKDSGGAAPGVNTLSAGASTREGGGSIGGRIEA